MNGYPRNAWACERLHKGPPAPEARHSADDATRAPRTARPMIAHTPTDITRYLPSHQHEIVSDVVGGSGQNFE